MRKLISFLLLTTLIGLSGCNLLVDDTTIVAYGDERDVDRVMAPYDTKSVQHDTFYVKYRELDHKKIVYVDRHVFDELMERKLLYTVTKKEKPKLLKRLKTERSRISYAASENDLPKEIQQTTVYEGPLLMGKQPFPNVDGIVLLSYSQYEELDFHEKAVHIATYEKEYATIVLEQFEQNVATEAIQYIIP